MAALTWRDVALPNFGGVSQAYQAAGQSFQQGLSGLAEGLKQFAADRQTGVDNSILARMSQIQDPQQMRQAQASGKFLEGVDLSKVNPKVLEAMNNRVGVLLNQASIEQGIANSKTSQAATQQNIDFGAQDQTRKLGQQAIQDAARPQIAKMLGLSGDVANLPGDDQQKLAQTTSGLATAALGRDGQRISNATGSFNLAKGRRDDAVGQGALNRAADLLSRYGTTDGLRSGIEESQFSNPAEKLATIAYLGKTTGQPLYTPLDAPVDKPTGRSGSASSGSNSNSGSGSGAAGKGGKGGNYTPPKTYEFQSEDARMADQALARVNAQDNSAGTLSAVARTINDFRPPLDIAKEIAEKIPGASQAKIADMIVKAKAKHPNMLPSEIGAALEFSPAGSRWYDSGNTTIGDDQGIDDKTFEANLTKMANGRVDYMSASNQNTRAARKALESADKALASAKNDLFALYRRSQSQNGKISTTDAENKVQGAQDRLNELLQLQKETASQQPTYEPVAPPPSDAQGLKRLFEAGKNKRGGN